MDTPMIIAPEDIIVDFTSEKGEIVADVTPDATEDYEYCFMGIRMTQAKVKLLKTNMLADSQFYVEIKFKDVLSGEVAQIPKFVHQVFDYSKLDETVEILELKMDGYYELPTGHLFTSVKVISAQVYYVEDLPVE